jgi:hypothetical protein
MFWVLLRPSGPCPGIAAALSALPVGIALFGNSRLERAVTVVAVWWSALKRRFNFFLFRLATLE